MVAVPLSELIETIGCNPCEDNHAIGITGVNSLQNADKDEISFLTNKQYQSQLGSTKAAAVLVDHATFAKNIDGSSSKKGPLLLPCSDPYLAYAKIQRFFNPGIKATGSRHPSAIIHPSSYVADSVDIGPTAVVGQGSRIESGCVIGAGVILGENCTINEGCILHARSVVADGCILGKRVILQSGAVIGSDGFGYAWSGQEHVKIPQVGIVILHDDVEIGANACIDRGAIGNTVISQGCKIDNLVQLGHNVEVGALSVIVSQAGIAGSTIIGNGCQLGGQVGVAGHIRLVDGCKVAGQSGVISNLDAAGTYGGTPAVPHRQWLRNVALINRLHEFMKKFK